MLRLSSLIALGPVLLTWACAAAPAKPAETPRAPAPSTEPAAKPDDGAGSTATDAERVPEPPAECKELVLEKPAAPPTCTGPSALAALADALGSGDENERDAKLRAVEACKDLPGGFVRALRAELAPVECGDVLTDPVSSHPPPGLDPELRDALMGLGLAAQAARLVRTPPRLEPPFDKARVESFVRGALGQWIEGQAKAIYSVSLRGSSLTGYGKGVVAIEAGLADLRFVDVARSAPIPAELEKDPELKDAYYSALEQALDPRKQRGRDAALVGLRKLAELGIVHDPRVDRARRLLSELYAGRRIDALDSLLLPPLAAPVSVTTEQKLAERLPTFYARLLLGNTNPAEPTLLRALLERGLWPAARDRVEKTPKLAAESRRLLARAELLLGQRYWQADRFAKAEALLGGAKLPPALAGEAELVVALAKALRSGPKDAAEMMLEGPHLPKGVGDVAALDELGKRKGPLGGMALFDAARLLEIAHPKGADAAYFIGVAERYEAASKLLTDAGQKSYAIDHARAARDTALEIGRK